MLFYKRQCEEATGQIQKLVTSIADLDPQYEELAKARAASESKAGEVTRLQNYISGLNSAVLSEKEHSLNLQGEVERLRIVELELNKEVSGRGER